MAVELRRSTCNRDCPDACGLVAEVEDGRLRSLKGDREHPVTRGFLCFRTSRFPEKLDAPERLRQPLLRRGGELVPVSYEEALDAAAERLVRIRAGSGPAAILHYRSGGSLGMLKGLADRFFEDFGPCATKVGDICSGAGEAAQEEDFGVSDSNDLFDLLDARHVLLWGKNPTVGSVHLVPVLKEARARGATLWSIDPVHHRTAGLADRVVQPAPGGDVALALGVGRALFERGAVDPRAGERCEGLGAYRELVHRQAPEAWARAAGVGAEVPGELAGALADGPTAILVGWGLQRRRHGGTTVRALDALSAVSGNLYRRGGGCSFYFARRAPFRAFHRGPGVAPRTIREPLLGRDVRAARDPRIRAIWVTAGNPVSMLPDSREVARAFEETEFTVVVDPFLTDTGRLADLVLPVPTLLEDDDVVGSYGHHWIGRVRPLVAPPEGVRHEVVMLQDLARRVGIDDRFPMEPVEELAAGVLRDVAPGRLDEGAVRRPGAPRVLFGDGRVDTPSGRVRLLDAVDPGAWARPADGGLWLFSNSTEKSQASVWAGRGPGERIWVAAHPGAVPGLRDGQAVVVENEQGRLDAVLRLDARQRTDVAVMPKGGHYGRGQSVNVLTPAVATDLGLGAAFLDCRVRIRAAD